MVGNVPLPYFVFSPYAKQTGVVAVYHDPPRGYGFSGSEPMQGGGSRFISHAHLPTTNIPHLTTENH